MTTEIYYRASADFRGSEDFPSEEDVVIAFDEYIVLRRTAKGAWIIPANYYGLPCKQRFVLDTSVKKFAHPTKEAALEGYQARTRRYMKILESRLRWAEAGLVAAEEGRVEK